ncbi:MAG: ATP-binding cassette domain-containing protein [Ignavibacteria bacterium]|nr:ATP-binding cassette domain-containing protein [Ignavibacteria bacterium]
MLALEIVNISKSFATVKAVEKLSFAVESGKIFGILGPNGAGKTTTIRIISGVFYQDEGEVIYWNNKNGKIPQERIGYLPEERGLYKKMKILDQLVYFGELKGMKKSEAITQAKKWLQRLDASDWINKKAQELSKGMQQKVQFIATILHNPDLIILDEPFSGFDPINVETFKQVILDLKKEGKTILLSTHIMEQAEQLCDDVILINKGKAILQGSLHQIKSQRAKDTVVCEFEGSNNFVANLRNVRIINLTQNRVEFRFNPSDFDFKNFLVTLLNETQITKIELTTPSLREIFIEEVTKGENQYA